MDKFKTKNFRNHSVDRRESVIESKRVKVVQETTKPKKWDKKGHVNVDK